MKRNLSIGLGILAALATLPILTSPPVLANLAVASEALAQNVFRPQVKLVLGAQKQVISTNAAGQTVKSWQSLKGQVQVQPGDVIRYTLSSENAGEQPAEKLVVTQPVPRQMVYRADSAKANGAKLTYSIDGGVTFSAQPMIEVKLPDGTVEQQPAPAARYTHIRWDYGESLQPLAAVRAIYEVTVR